MVEDKLLTLADVRERVRFSKAHIYKLVRKGRFPKPLHVGGASRWRASDVQSWIASLCAPSEPGRAA